MNIASAGQVGFSASRLERLDGAMQRYIDEGKLAGIVVMLARQGQVFHTGCYGHAVLPEENVTGRPVRPDTLFRLWSVTKAITTVAALTLYERGLFTLDQDISEFLPAFRATQVYAGGDGDTMQLVDKERPITVRQLLTHSAGMASISSTGPEATPPERLTQQAIEKVVASRGTLETLADALAGVPLAAQPNTIWRYSQSFEVVARLVEVISGQSFAAYLQQTIFEPLRMTDTGYIVGADRLDRYSAFYAPVDVGPERKGGLKLIEAPDRSINYIPDGRLPEKIWTPGGHGLVSTPVDVMRFATMLLQRGELDGARVLAPSTVDLMAANHLPPALLPYQFSGGQPFYGYGHGLGVHVLMDRGLAGVPCANGEYWKDGGSGTLFWVDPRHALTGVVMYQLDPFWIYPVWAQVKALTYQAML